MSARDAWDELSEPWRACIEEAWASWCAGSAGVAVDPYGNVYPCVQWRRPVGNLHQQSIGEIWTTSAGLRQVRELTTQAKGLVDSYGPAGALLVSTVVMA